MSTELYFLNQWQAWVIILVVVLLLFGATRLPALSKSIGQSIRIFRKEIKDPGTDATSSTTTSGETPSSTEPTDRS